MKAIRMDRTARAIGNMPFLALILAAGCVMGMAIAALGEEGVYYVTTNGPADGDGSSWERAFTNISAAVAGAGDGETVLVSNGTYVSSATITLDTGVTLQGFGPESTILAASAPTNRLVRVNHSNAMFSGFTVRSSSQGGLHLQAGVVSNCWFTQNSLNAYQAYGAGIYMAGGLVTHCRIVANTNSYAGQSGGGLYIHTTGGTIQNSVIVSNKATGPGGGAAVNAGRMRNCLIAGNRAIDKDSGMGGGVAMGGAGTRMDNCTIAGNVCSIEKGGGGLYKSAGIVSNTVVSGNWRGPFVQNIDGVSGGTGSVFFSCAPELATGGGNIGANPLFADVTSNSFRLGPGSPCLDTGTNATWMLADTTDLDGQQRLQDGNGDTVASVDMGCFESPPSGSGSLRCQFGAAPDRGYVSLDTVFTAYSDGTAPAVTWYGWDFDADGTNDLSGGGLGIVTQSFAPGLYAVRLTVSNGSGQVASVLRSPCIRVDALDYFVSTNGTHTAPYDTWNRASTNLRTVAEYARADGTTGVVIHVGPGTYAESAPVVAWQPLQIVSAQGPSRTVLRWPLANDRIIKVQHPGSLFTGFTVRDGRWGGLLLENGTVSNCWLVNNVPYTHWIHGGGLNQSGGLATHCLIAWNTNHTANNQGAGASLSGGMLRNSIISSNVARSGVGGGIQMTGPATVRNCLIADNRTTAAGGAGGGLYMNAAGALIESCTVAGNICPATADGGGINKAAGVMTNVIVQANLKGSLPQDLVGTGNVVYSCAPELVTGTGNLTSNPVFRNPAAGDYHLRLRSPCVDAGTNLAWMEAATDLDGARRRQIRVDMGAYETPSLNKSVIMLR
jgi:hypothetical protein